MAGIRLFQNPLRLGDGFFRARGGNVAVVFALAAVPLVGAVGAAVDFAKASDVKAQMQNALDAAVLAGVTQASANQISTAGQVFDGDFGTKFRSSATRSFTQNANGSLSGTASTGVPLSLLSVFFSTQIPVTVTAMASPGKQATSPVCILLLSQLDSQALLVNSGAQLNAPSCEVHVVSTQNPAAMFNATLNVKRICVKGANVTKNGGVTPPTVTNCSTIADPFAGKLPTVSADGCSNVPSGNNNVNVNPNDGAKVYPAGTYGSMNFNNSSVTLNPGVFCGSINFNSVSNGTLKLNPGRYEIHGTWNVNSGWTVDGNGGVTFYFVDQNAMIHFNSTTSATLTAPTTGTDANILMFEPGGLSTSYPTIDSSTLNMTGLIYLPSRKLTANSTLSASSGGSHRSAGMAMTTSKSAAERASWRSSSGTRFDTPERTSS